MLFGQIKLMDFYKGNAIYDLIKSVNNFYHTDKNSWILLYGDSNFNPKVILFLSGYSNLDYESKTLSYSEGVTKTLCENLSQKSKIPFLYVRFNQDKGWLDELIIYKSNEFIKMNINDYVNLLVSFGLDKSSVGSTKQINSRASSIYHIWQFNCGLNIKTSDIDLLYIEDKLIKYVFELKRSFISLDRWKPFLEDYNNFILLSKFLKKCDIKLFILFNNYVKQPYKDDISSVKIFRIEYDRDLIINELGLHTIHDFLINLENILYQNY